MDPSSVRRGESCMYVQMWLEDVVYRMCTSDVGGVRAKQVKT
jgi:hypothetical protein